ncbi:hypothetical protein BGZ92_000352 [Podila epicladia]|nr:hypothetical protein BGZ92_000352 [Podila epicladia]
MKTTAALLATICVTASFVEAQGGVHPLDVGPNQCGFYAALSFTNPDGIQSHCKVVVALNRNQYTPCADLADGWTVPANARDAAANKCLNFNTRYCHPTSSGPAGQFCFGSAGDRIMLRTVMEQLKDCLRSIQDKFSNINNWAYSCGDGSPLDYKQF